MANLIIVEIFTILFGIVKHDEDRESNNQMKASRNTKKEESEKYSVKLMLFEFKTYH